MLKSSPCLHTVLAALDSAAVEDEKKVDIMMLWTSEEMKQQRLQDEEVQFPLQYLEEVLTSLLLTMLGKKTGFLHYITVEE